MKMSRLTAFFAGFATLGVLATATPAIAQTMKPFSVDHNFGNGSNPQSVNPNFDDYAWFLRWKDGGVQHFGKLMMNNNGHGKLVVYTDVLNRPIKQDIKLKRSANSFLLQGYNPSHPNYSADKFRFQLGNSPSDITKIQHCSTGPCVPIHFQKYHR